MDERPLIRTAPVAARASRFVDGDGRNAFRDLEPEASVPNGASVADGAVPYASEQGGGVRPYQEGDFVVTQVAVSWSILAQSCIAIAAVAFGWFSYFVVWVGLVDELWYWFVGAWFIVAHLTACICVLRAIRDRKLARLGVIAADEKPAIQRAFAISLGAFMVTLASLLAVVGVIVLA
ncbi:MAG: hypothetical protein U1A77_12885 [Pirellulales bacterium]|jgi:hypothetical protein